MRSRWIGDRAVGALGLGTASLSLVEDADDAGSERLIELAIENGVSYLDTAAAYTRAGVAAHSERMIARVLKRTSADVMVGTKGGHYRDDAIWPVDGRPESIRANCIASLRALETACLDLYFLHKPDLEVDFEDSVGELESLRRDGLVARTGVSNVSLSQLDSAAAITPLAAIQNSFSPFELGELALIDECEKRGIAYLAYSPLGASKRSRPWQQVLPTVAGLAHKRTLSVESVVLAWELDAGTGVVPILGATRPATLLDSLRADAIDFDEPLRDAMASDLAALRIG